MNKNKFGEILFSENDLIDSLMTKAELPENCIANDTSVDKLQLDHVPMFLEATDESISVAEFDKNNQSNWYMPEEYKNFDVAEHVLNLCSTEEQLQRVGKELLLYQEKNLFELLQYLKYLVDTMEQNQIIWGVGRGSSVASYVLYLLKVHRIDSLHYELDPTEFLR